MCVQYDLFYYFVEFYVVDIWQWIVLFVDGVGLQVGIDFCIGYWCWVCFQCGVQKLLCFIVGYLQFDFGQIGGCCDFFGGVQVQLMDVIECWVQDFDVQLIFGQCFYFGVDI